MFTTSAVLDGFRTLSSAEFAPWLLDTAVKASVLLLITGIAAWLLRRRSAALVHRVWTLGFCGCLVIPFATYFAPLGTLPILPPLSQTAPFSNVPATLSGPATAPFTAAVSPSTAADVEQLPNEPLNLSQALGPQTPASSTPLSGQPATAVRVPSPPAPTTSAERISWPRLLLGVWLAGIAIFLLRAGCQVWRLTRVLRRSAAVESDLWSAAVADAAQSLGLRRRIKVAMVPGARIPAVTGIWRPLLLLPTDAESWSPERRRLVLLHELAHAQRRDVLTHAIAHLVCAAHWFNPLCWFGLIQMGRLRELACDDLVLTSGQAPADYADVLLDVARSYRRPTLGLAVGMARRANVEDRILAILDRARNRMSLSPRAARRWALGMLALVLLLGCLRATPSNSSGSSSQPSGDGGAPAVEAAGAENQESDTASAATTADGDVRTMVVRITDEAGMPLENASLHVSVWEIEGAARDFPNRDFETSAEGVVDVELPKRMRILRMWPAKHGYVPEFVNFAEGTHDEGLLIPDRYEFQLAKGTELSGTVVDEDGKPIPDVKVEVMVDVREPAWTTNPDTMISTWLTDSDFNSEAPVTNTDGKWSISNAPRPTEGAPHVFWLKHTHPNYVKDTEWGDLQKKQGVTTAMLRDGTAKIVLPRGAGVKGTVVDPTGKPVTKGLVIWHDNPYLAEGVNEAAIDDQGRFETLPLSPGEYPITVVARGFAPVQRKVTVAKGMDELRLELRPGKRLVMKIVDRGGHPVPNAHVGIVRWGETEAIYNHKHPNVPDSGIPRNADEHGVYVWDWAPDDAVTYYVSSKGHSLLRDVTLIANGEEHVVELPQELVAFGQVTDAQTREPVKHFRVIPVTVFRPQFLSTSHDDAVGGEGGRYQIQLSEQAERDHRYQVRIEAQGYRSELSEQSFGQDDGRVEVNFALERAAGRVGKVVDADGNPVAGASIVQGTPSDVPMMRDGALEHGTDLKTGSDGTFELLATFEPVRIRALHATGFAEVLRQPDDDIGTIELQPWAKLSGQLLQDGQPIADQWVFFSPVPDRGLGEARFQEAYHTQTDADGRFTFSRIPPGFGSVRAQLGPWEESPLTSSESAPVDLQPGEHKEIALGGTGITVTGTVNSTGRGDVELNKNWSLNYLIRRDADANLPDDFPTLSFDPSGPAESSWFLKPDAYAWLATRPNYFVKLSPDGQFTIHGVAPGQYDLVLRLYEQPAGCLVETIGEQVISVEITADDAAAGTKDVGTIDVPCRAGPRIGQNMQAYKIVDATGRERTIFDLQGGYVVLHVWASWCAPCLAHMPEIQQSVADWKERPVTIVGLNIDEDRSQAESLVDQNGWKWAQMYLGDDSDMGRQLAISTVPTYYLIGPDGLLAASSNDWSAIRDSIESAIGDRHE